MKKILNILLLSLSFQGFSCDCNGIMSIENAFKFSESIFIGKVISINKISKIKTLTYTSQEMLKDTLEEKWYDYLQSNALFEVQFIVQKSLKGITADTISIFTEISAASCGFPFKLKSLYFVYGDVKGLLIPGLGFQPQYIETIPKHYWTTHCGRTTERTNTELYELKRLNLVE